MEKSHGKSWNFKSQKGTNPVTLLLDLFKLSKR